MKKSESISKIAPALIAAQSELSNPKNTAENPFFKSKYAPLSEIINIVRPILAKNGLVISQDVETVGDTIKVSTLLLHSSGEWLEQEGVSLKMEKNTAQGAGSAVTYARRYMLSAMMNLSSEDDDDGNTATHGQARPSQNAPVAPKQAQPTPDKAKVEALKKLNSLPTNVKDGFKILGYGESAQYTFCTKFGWDSARLMKEINNILAMKQADKK